MNDHFLNVLLSAVAVGSVLVLLSMTSCWCKFFGHNTRSAGWGTYETIYCLNCGKDELAESRQMLPLPRPRADQGLRCRILGHRTRYGYAAQFITCVRCAQSEHSNGRKFLPLPKTRQPHGLFPRNKHLLCLLIGHKRHDDCDICWRGSCTHLFKEEKT